MVGGMGKNAINKLGEQAIQAFVRKARAGQATASMLSDGGGTAPVTPSGGSLTA